MTGQFYGSPVNIKYFFEKRNGWKKEINGTIGTEQVLAAVAKLCLPFMRVLERKEKIYWDAGEIKSPDDPNNTNILEGKVDRIEIKVFYKEQ